MVHIIETVSHQLVIDGFNAKSPSQYLNVFNKKKAKLILEILDKMAKIDVQSVERAKKRGLNAFSSTRYPTSLVKTFLFFCEKFKKTHTEKDAQEVYRIGKLAFEVEPALVDGSREVLDFLRKKKQELVLFTRGDEVVQMRKLQINNLLGYFSEIHIVHHKDATILSRIVGNRKKEHVFMVGNSFKSDIMPALELNIRALYIPKETWKYEEDYSAMRLMPKLMIPLEKITEIIDRFQEF